MNVIRGAQGTTVRRRLSAVSAVAALGRALAAASAGSRRAGRGGGRADIDGGRRHGRPGGERGAVTTPCGASFGDGNLYIADWAVVRKIKPATDWLTTPAGSYNAPLGDDGGLAVNAGMQTCRVAADQHGNLVIGDSGNDRVRVAAASTGTFYGQAMTADHIYTVAGNGKAGFSGDGGPATAAELRGASVAVDHHGNLVIDDGGNNRIRVVAASTGTFYGQAMTADTSTRSPGTVRRASPETADRPPRPGSARPPSRWITMATWSSTTAATTGSGSWPPAPAPSTARP